MAGFFMENPHLKWMIYGASPMKCMEMPMFGYNKQDKPMVDTTIILYLLSANLPYVVGKFPD